MRREYTPKQRGTKLDILTRTAQRTTVDRVEVERIVEAFLDEVRAAVWGCNRILIPGLGVFRIGRRKARRILDPNSGKPIRLPARREVRFRASANWRT